MTLYPAAHHRFCRILRRVARLRITVPITSNGVIFRFRAPRWRLGFSLDLFLGDLTTGDAVDRGAARP